MSRPLLLLHGLLPLQPRENRRRIDLGPDLLQQLERKDQAIEQMAWVLFGLVLLSVLGLVVYFA